VDAPTMGTLTEFALKHHHAVLFAPHLQKVLTDNVTASFLLFLDLFVHDFEEDRYNGGVLADDNVVDHLVQLVERDDFHDLFKVIARIVNRFVQLVDLVCFVAFSNLLDCRSLGI